MKVRMLTLSAGPGGVIERGTIIDMPDDKAEAFVAKGFAEYIEKRKEVIPSDAIQRNDEPERTGVDRARRSNKPRKSAAGRNG